ncbi:MAG TPA: hypothetical protein VHV10_10390 [Ktedonobacteraceae bacterium]|nr:hypothetical protein [Ktedonobacteraceae bacterium]
MAKIKSEVSQTQPQSLQNAARSEQAEQDTVQSTAWSELQELQPTAPNENKVVHRIEPRYPNWPTSKPGPQSTSPLAGMRPINTFRSEQVAEIGYNQETGEPSVDSPLYSTPDISIHGPTSFDHPKNAHDALGKRKQRL